PTRPHQSPGSPARRSARRGLLSGRPPRVARARRLLPGCQPRVGPDPVCAPAPARLVHLRPVRRAIARRLALSQRPGNHPSPCQRAGGEGGPGLRRATLSLGPAVSAGPFLFHLTPRLRSLTLPARQKPPSQQPEFRNREIDEYSRDI